MRQTIFLLLVCGFFRPQYLSAQDTVRIYFNEYLAPVKRSQMQFTGLLIRAGDHWYLYTLYPDTSLLAKSFFKDRNLRTKDGLFTLYYRKKGKMLEGSYVNNIKQGVWKYWYENGNLRDSGLVKNNFCVGYWKSWYPDGHLMEAGYYDSPESIHESDIPDLPKSRKSAGILAGDTLVRRRSGIWESWYPNGVLKDSGAYGADQKTGYWMNWFENGTKESEGNYGYQGQEGDWTYYYENGNPSTRETYRNGKISNLECFDSSGKATGPFCSILKPPVPLLDRFTDFNTYALDHIFWPSELDGQDVNGIVRVQFKITKAGIMEDFKVLAAPHPLLGKEVERFLRTITKWSPAMYHNRPQDYTETVEIPFYR